MSFSWNSGRTRARYRRPECEEGARLFSTTTARWNTSATIQSIRNISIRVEHVLPKIALTRRRPVLFPFFQTIRISQNRQKSCAQKWDMRAINVIYFTDAPLQTDISWYPVGGCLIPGDFERTRAHQRTTYARTYVNFPPSIMYYLIIVTSPIS